MKACKQWLRILAANVAISFLPPILLLSMAQSVSWRRLWSTFVFSLVYANCIGTMASLTLPRVWMVGARFARWIQWTIRVAALLAVAIAGSLVACLVFLAFGWVRPGEYWLEFLGSLKIAIFLTFLAGGVISLYETMRSRLDETTLQLRTKELERERAFKLATEAQLASLESRIHPHFLFNTLNSISSLIPEDPARAERLVEQMAALLRFSLDSKQAGLVPLAAELKVVGDYLEIERARFGDRLRYRIDTPSGAENIWLPPLSVQTLVENSVKFAVAPNRAGGEIRVSGIREDGLLHVRVSDDGPEFRLESAPPGHGLDTLKGRLETLFGARATLSLERRDNRNNLLMSVPQSPHDHTRVSG